MKTLIIHFGMHKTGSSSIQASLFNGACPSIRYISFNSPNSSRAIVAAFSGSPEENHAFQKRQIPLEEIRRTRESVRRQLREALAEAGSTFVLSAESIMTLKEEELAELHAFVKPHVDRVVAAGYVRAPRSYMESSFQEVAKYGMSRDFRLETYVPRYRASFGKYERVLGRENVLLWKFDPKGFPANCVVRDFAGRFGIPVAVAKIIRTNEGVSKQAIGLLYAYNKFGQGLSPGPRVMLERRLLVEKVSELQGEKIRFDTEMVKPFMHRMRADIAWMEERLGVSLAEPVVPQQGNAIRSLRDLLRFAPDTLRWLAGQIGVEYREGGSAVTGKTVADWMHRLRLKLIADYAGRPRAREGSDIPERIVVSDKMNKRSVDMKLKEIIDQAKETVPQLEGISDGKAAALLREVFRLVGEEVEKVDDGVVKIAGLGNFLVKQVDREKDGKKEKIKRIVFKPAKPKEA